MGRRRIGAVGHTLIGVRCRQVYAVTGRGSPLYPRFAIDAHTTGFGHIDGAPDKHIVGHRHYLVADAVEIGVGCHLSDELGAPGMAPCETYVVLPRVFRPYVGAAVMVEIALIERGHAEDIFHRRAQIEFLVFHQPIRERERRRPPPHVALGIAAMSSVETKCPQHASQSRKALALKLHRRRLP